MRNQQEEKPGCLTAVLGMFGITPKQDKQGFRGAFNEEKKENLPYRVREDFLSPAEISFFHVLSNVVQTRALIFPKVRLADIFFVSNPHQNLSYFNQISAKHVDFLLCQPGSLKPVVGIELDDESHNRPSRQERDEFIEKVFEASSLPLIRYPVRHTYSMEEIGRQVFPIIEPQESHLQQIVIPRETSTESKTPTTPFCPKCGIPMVLRTASQGANKGKQFYGCVNYPRCHEVEQYPYSEKKIDV